MSFYLPNFKEWKLVQLFIDQAHIVFEIKTRRSRYEGFNISSFGDSLGIVVRKNYCKNQGSPEP